MADSTHPAETPEEIAEAHEAGEIRDIRAGAILTPEQAGALTGDGDLSAGMPEPTELPNEDGSWVGRQEIEPGIVGAGYLEPESSSPEE